MGSDGPFTEEDKPHPTYQLIGNVEEEVERLDAVGTVLPLGVHHHTRLLVHPRKEVVGVAVVDRVRGGRGRGGSWGVVVQLVAVVT